MNFVRVRHFRGGHYLRRGTGFLELACGQICFEDRVWANADEKCDEWENQNEKLTVINFVTEMS